MLSVFLFYLNIFIFINNTLSKSCTQISEHKHSYFIKVVNPHKPECQRSSPQESLNTLSSHFQNDKFKCFQKKILSIPFCFSNPQQDIREKKTTIQYIPHFHSKSQTFCSFLSPLQTRKETWTKKIIKPIMKKKIKPIFIST